MGSVRRPGEGRAGAAAVRSLQRALTILLTFDGASEPRTLAELTARTGLPKTTVVRLARTLAEAGFLAQDSSGRYLLGPSALRLGHAAQRQWRLPEVARTVMRQLSQLSGETVNLYVVHGIHRVCIAQEEGVHTVRQVVPVGHALPLWAGASGRVLLAHQPPGVLERVLREAGERVDVLDLQRRLQATRADGYAVSHGEREPGASSVAAPVFAPDGEVAAALAISGPTSRYTPDRVEQLVALVRGGAREISDALRGSSPPAALGARLATSRGGGSDVRAQRAGPL